MARKATESRFKLQGFTRVHLKEGKKLVGDSGWVGPNMVVNGGIQQFILNCIAKTTGSLQVGAMAVGTGGAPASDAISLANEYGGTAKRKAVTVATSQRAASNGTATLQFSASWASGDNSGSSNIANVGLFDVSTAAGSLFAGNTYASSTWSNNQDLYASYQVRISFS
ncbi:MAG: hypothetical protein ABIJ57_02300 [Pseudomonadota bacterium]